MPFAGVDIATQILGRQVQALVHARRGEHADAQSLAREAVALSEQARAIDALPASLGALDDDLHEVAQMGKSVDELRRPRVEVGLDFRSVDTARDVARMREHRGIQFIAAQTARRAALPHTRRAVAPLPVPPTNVDASARENVREWTRDNPGEKCYLPIAEPR